MTSLEIHFSAKNLNFPSTLIVRRVTCRMACTALRTTVGDGACVHHQVTRRTTAVRARCTPASTRASSCRRCWRRRARRATCRSAGSSTRSCCPAWRPTAAATSPAGAWPTSPRSSPRCPAAGHSRRCLTSR